MCNSLMKRTFQYRYSVIMQTLTELRSTPFIRHSNIQFLQINNTVYMGTPSNSFLYLFFVLQSCFDRLNPSVLFCFLQLDKRHNSKYRRVSSHLREISLFFGLSGT